MSIKLLRTLELGFNQSKTLSCFSTSCKVSRRKMNNVNNSNESTSTDDVSCRPSEFVKEEEMSRGKWLSLNCITYKDPTGKHRIWEAVNRTTRENSESSDAVCVIAIVKRVLKYDCLVLVRQYRPPMKGYTLEFPAGLIDGSETAVSCAERELKEETGYSGIVKHVSPVTCLDPGIGNTTVQFVTMEVDGDLECNKHPKQALEESEFIETVVIPEEEVLEKLHEYSKAGTVVDSRVYAFAFSLSMTKSNKLFLQ